MRLVLQAAPYVRINGPLMPLGLLPVVAPCGKLWGGASTPIASNALGVPPLTLARRASEGELPIDAAGERPRLRVGLV
jgi:hypothetical protein